MSAPTPPRLSGLPPRWPALVGLRAFLREDLGLVGAALFAPFVLALCHLRRRGHAATWTYPDPASLPERLQERWDNPSEGVLPAIAFFACFVWAAALVVGLGLSIVLACGGGS